MKAKNIYMTVCCVGVLTSVASATLVNNADSFFPIDETGWEVRVSEQFSGKVFVLYDRLENDAVWIELRKEFDEFTTFQNDMGDSLQLEFRLADKNAVNFASDIVIKDETIINSTGRTWTDFHIELAFNLNSYGDVGFDPDFIFEGPIDDFNPFIVQFDPFSYHGILVNDLSTPLKIDFLDGELPSGQDLLPGFGGSGQNYVRIITSLDEGDSFIIKEWPTIPEPATLSLLAFGLIPLLRRRKLS